ncbi:recombinase RecT [Devosia sp. YIM 151766]|uniref:recombinase RecT n=1 Tax=Devosia sp. YIM 151766 TaxID=3017325 RepID=UPI00255C2A4B|nr:recombinase RecT [Devosia sp. YIM 151766]WIY54112.1 recombinase RecT [Devosia sp. YIM 151766]
MMSNVTTLPRPLTGGGHVMAIVPQTFEETYRVAKAVYMGGLAPAALIGKLEGDAAISAVTVAIMSGAELGLQPMVALRSFTVINGKPALYGDGLINVVRMSGRVAYLRTGCDERDGQMIGWCEAKRNDTGEDKRVEFSQEDAVRAGLWQTEAIVTKWNKWDKKNEQKPNDSPWFRFPKRMLAWRAAGYCLRELFGDVLGGIRDEFEAREIAEVEDMRDVTPAALTPPSPPSPPSPPVAPAAEPDEPIIDEQPEAVTGEQDFDAAAFFEDLEIAMAAAKDADGIEAAWSELDVEATLTSDETNLEIANKIKARAMKRVSTPQPPSPPQDDMFPGDRP